MNTCKVCGAPAAKSIEDGRPLKTCGAGPCLWQLKWFAGNYEAGVDPEVIKRNSAHGDRLTRAHKIREQYFHGRR